ncbi:MAG: methyl-accepting chemotaxis protein [Aquabacterium sp.]
MPFPFFARVLRGSLSFVGELTGASASRDLTRRAAAQQALAGLSALDEAMQTKLQEAVSLSGEATLDMLQRANQIHQHSTRLVGYLGEAQHQSESMQGSIDENAQIISQLAAFIEHLPRQIADERQHFQRVVGDVRRLGDMTEAIQAMARQTEILAINAAIEAARAGESGRGFAVLAGEVRRLATESKDTASRIEQDIDRLVHTVSGEGSQDFQARADHNEAESRRLAELTRKLDESYVDLRQFYKMLLNAVTTHNLQLDAQIAGLLDAGQYQDVFKQIIDRTGPAMALRHQLATELIHQLLDGAQDIEEVRTRAAGLVDHYHHLEQQHGGVLTAAPDADADASAGAQRIEFF